MYFCFFKQKTAYEMRISDWSSDVCSSDLLQILAQPQMGISGKNGGAGPYRRERRGKAWPLAPVRDESDSGEEEPPAPRSARRVLRAERIAVAIVRFIKGLTGLVLGRRYSDLPLLSVSNGYTEDVGVYPDEGLFGL